MWLGMTPPSREISKTKKGRRTGPGHALEAALGNWAAAARPALSKAGSEQQRALGMLPMALARDPLLLPNSAECATSMHLVLKYLMTKKALLLARETN